MREVHHSHSCTVEVLRHVVLADKIAETILETDALELESSFLTKDRVVKHEKDNRKVAWASVVRSGVDIVDDGTSKNHDNLQLNKVDGNIFWGYITAVET